MTIHPNMSASHTYASNIPKVNYARQEASESTKGPDNDNDSDDRRVSQPQKTSPTINASGQTIGKNISLSA